MLLLPTVTVDRTRLPTAVASLHEELLRACRTCALDRLETLLQQLTTWPQSLPDHDVVALFQCAIETANPELLGCLLRSGLHGVVSNPTQLAHELLTALVQEGDATLVRQFLSVTQLTVPSRGLLLLAADQDNADMITTLLAHGADPNDTRADDHSTALHLAVEWNNTAVLRQLLDAGADVDAAASSGETPLHTAVLHGHLEAVEALLDVGADMTATTDEGSTPLHLAARECHVDILELLLERGADLRAQDDDGRTPLHVAAFFDESAARFARGDHDSQLTVVDRLLRRGADASARDAQGNTPLHVAQAGHFELIVDRLLRHVHDQSNL
ncbi:hypothetical protein ATCC90586_004944 [Pythium insidiosum]|nr:hypothetical protein ATCC90586_004944 [Pythium insidiosum]